MKLGDDFDLRSGLEKLFPNLSLRGDILHQGPFGVKFDIGITHIDRATAIFYASFRQAGEVVLLSEDASWEDDIPRWYELFALPGLLHSSETPGYAHIKFTAPRKRTTLCSGRLSNAPPCAPSDSSRR